ncbi:hypothetical protein M2167_008289 [Streptomyces sp. SPB4]|nr:hypothetical protein [Streptomyces sp. SPB4]MDH6545711.1 hypothetical protein [Streptomyces sp. SPB4]
MAPPRAHAQRPRSCRCAPGALRRCAGSGSSTTRPPQPRAAAPHDRAPAAGASSRWPEEEPLLGTCPDAVVHPPARDVGLAHAQRELLRRSAGTADQPRPLHLRDGYFRIPRGGDLQADPYGRVCHGRIVGHVDFPARSDSLCDESARSWRRALYRPRRASRAPRSSNTRTTAAPSPRAAPVTTTVRPPQGPTVRSHAHVAPEGCRGVRCRRAEEDLGRPAGRCYRRRGRRQDEAAGPDAGQRGEVRPDRPEVPGLTVLGPVKVIPVPACMRRCFLLARRPSPNRPPTRRDPPPAGGHRGPRRRDAPAFRRPPQVS